MKNNADDFFVMAIKNRQAAAWHSCFYLLRVTWIYLEKKIMYFSIYRITSNESASGFTEFSVSKNTSRLIKSLKFWVFGLQLM